MREELQQRLSQKGYRLTRPREIIWELLRSASCHPDANWIYIRARKLVPHLSLGTVYRTLNILCEAGLAQEIRCGGAQARYDGNTEEHCHIVCRRCGVLEDVPELSLQQLASQVSERTAFHVEGRQVEFCGLCPNCQQQEKDA